MLNPYSQNISDRSSIMLIANFIGITKKASIINFQLYLFLLRPNNDFSAKTIEPILYDEGRQRLKLGGLQNPFCLAI